MATISGDGTAVTGLGGPSGYGETALPRGDDTVTQVDVSAVFEEGFTLDGVTYGGDELFISTDGFVTFGAGAAGLPDDPADLTMPFIAIFMADVDTRLDGEAPESGQIWLDIDAAGDCVTITWEDVGFYRRDASLTNTFQMQLYDLGGGAMDVVFRYEEISWTTGDLQGGWGGLGGTPAFVGWREAASGAPVELAASRDGAALLALPTTPGNTGVAGLYVIRMGPADVPLVGSEGNDTLTGSAGADDIRALGGDDWVLASAGGDTVDGGAGFDLLDFALAPDAIVLNLSKPSANRGWAEGLGLTGVEALAGSAWDDRLTGAGANDWFSGAGGADKLAGKGGKDSLYGEAGLDTLKGGGGADRLYGGEEADLMQGGAGKDRLYGGGGDDTALGGEANDQLTGGGGADALSGQGGADALFGGSGGDALDGGAGADTLWGDEGQDWLTGGGGADLFAHSGTGGQGSDLVLDYDAQQGDLLYIDQAGLTAGDFTVTYATAPGLGDDALAEAYVTLTATGEVLWVVVDGAGMDAIFLQSMSSAPIALT